MEHYTVEFNNGWWWVVDTQANFARGESRWIRNTTSEDEAQSLAKACNEWLHTKYVKPPSVPVPA